MANSRNSGAESGSWSGAWPSRAADPALVRGIAAYRRHPWQRSIPDPPVLWAEGDSRLLAYGAAGAGPVLLVVPSLVNRAHVLDLLPDHSMLRWLAAQGTRPILLDWGWPGEVERRFTLTDYVAGRLERAMAFLSDTAAGPVVLAGYCMGGLLALAAAIRRPDRVRALALLATPWEFGAIEGAARLGGTLPLLEPLLAATGTLPVDAIQALFAMGDPGGVAAKYRSFGRLDQGSEAARRFVALEDWLNDGIPLAAPVARDCLDGWYLRNAPGRGEWRIAGQPVDPSALEMPAFVAVPGRDRLVPPGSAVPLAGLLRRAVLHQPDAGHVGMVAGSRGRDALWAPLLHWLRGL